MPRADSAVATMPQTATARVLVVAAITVGGWLLAVLMSGTASAAETVDPGGLPDASTISAHAFEDRQEADAADAADAAASADADSEAAADAETPAAATSTSETSQGEESAPAPPAESVTPQTEAPESEAPQAETPQTASVATYGTGAHSTGTPTSAAQITAAAQQTAAQSTPSAAQTVAEADAAATEAVHDSGIGNAAGDAPAAATTGDPGGLAGTAHALAHGIVDPVLDALPRPLLGLPGLGELIPLPVASGEPNLGGAPAPAIPATTPATPQQADPAPAGEPAPAAAQASNPDATENSQRANQHRSPLSDRSGERKTTSATERPMHVGGGSSGGGKKLPTPVAPCAPASTSGHAGAGHDTGQNRSPLAIMPTAADSTQLRLLGIGRGMPVADTSRDSALPTTSPD